MAALPPAYAPAVAVDDDEDDGFDWEAAVREIDSACALASTASVSNPAPPPRQPSAYPPSAPAPSAAAPFFHGPSAGGARQSTLDRFVDSFTKRQAAKDRPPPAPVVPVVVAVAPASGGGRFAVRYEEGCSRRAGDEDAVVEGACAVALDHEAVQTWIYPKTTSKMTVDWRGKERRRWNGRFEPLVMWSLPAMVRNVGAKVEKEVHRKEGRQR